MLAMSPRGPYARGVAKREEILGVALDLFARKGYDRTSVREVARMTGLSQAGLLHYFSSKEELFTEVLRHRDVRNEEAYAAGPVNADGLISIVRRNSEEPGLVRLYATMSAEATAADNPAHTFFDTRYRDLRAALAADIRSRQDAGEIAKDIDSESVASLLIAAADGLQVQWLLAPERADMGDELGLLWSLIRRVR